MADKHVNIVAVLTPAPGKKDRVESLLLNLAKEVYDKEPGVLRYHLHYQEETGELVLIERYADEATFESHKKQEAFQNVMKIGQEEKLLSKPLELKMLRPIGGHETR